MKGKIVTITVVVVVAVLITAAAAFAGSQLVFAQGQPGGSNIISNIISQVTGATPQAPAVKGLVAVYVNSGGPADTAGVKRGDIILTIGSTTVNTPADVKSALANSKPGDTVTLTIYRGQKKMDIKVTLEEARGGNTARA